MHFQHLGIGYACKYKRLVRGFEFEDGIDMDPIRILSDFKLCLQTEGRKE